MFDREKIDSYFNADAEAMFSASAPKVSKHTRFVRIAKLALPSAAAVLIGLLLVFPTLKKDARDFKLEITRPKQGELEKLHVENTVLYMTDKNNQVNNFTADRIDETAPGSKLIKLINPEGLIPLSHNNWASIKAPTGFYDQNRNTMRLTDNVELFYSEGMTVYTFDADYDFNLAQGIGTNQVEAEGYFGNLTADGFEFFGNQDLIVFTGHNDITIKEESLKGK